ncbi:MAG: ABC transporter permease, partial [Deltaproteobacteria bacterium]|nr:ABC transporter permease [Deltaproteobacteria bacterium]
MTVKTEVPEQISEWRLLWADPWLRALVSWVPPLLFLSIYLIFSLGLARDLSVGVVDLDQSRLSRELIRYYDASPTLAIDRHYLSPAEGISAMRGGEIYGLVLIEKDTERDIISGHPPQVELFYNGQYLLIGKLVKSALLQAHATAVAKIDTLKNLSASSPVIGQAMAAAVPVGNQVTPLFNSSTNYAQFLVSAIIPAIWQILIVMTTVLSIGLELRREGLSSWLNPHPVQALLHRFMPYTLIFWLHGILFLITMYVFLGWPMHGNLGFLVFSQLLTVCGCQASGALIFFLSKDPARSLGLAAAYAAPGFAFMGVTFPVTDMTLPARIWRSLLPVSHYIDIQIAQVNYGAPLSLSQHQVQNL